MLPSHYVVLLSPSHGMSHGPDGSLSGHGTVSGTGMIVTVTVTRIMPVTSLAVHHD